MDLEGAIPTFIHISDGRLHDVNVLDMIPIIAGSIYIMNRGYLDFERLFTLHEAGGKFVVRARKNLQFYRKSSTPVDRSNGLQCDQIIRLTGPNSKFRYPHQLRRVHLIDKEHGQDLVLLSNITTCSATRISDYYKQRWQIELFFQMDQRAPAYQRLLWTEYKCRKDPDLDGDLHLFNHDNIP